MTDLRTQRTTRLIQVAFIHLINSEGFQQVTVTQIAAEAMINRQTFYRHFNDKYDLAEHLASTTIAGFDNAITQRLRLAASPHHDQERVVRVLTDIMDSYVADRIEMLTALMTLKEDPLDFRDRLHHQFEHRYQQYFAQITPDHEALEIQANLFSAVALGSLDYILKHKQIPAAESVLEGIRQILTAFV